MANEEREARPRVLLADDDGLIRATICMMLDHRGVEPLSAVIAEDALRALQHHEVAAKEST